MAKIHYERCYMAYCRDHKQYHCWVDDELSEPNTVHVLTNSGLEFLSKRITERLSRSRELLLEVTSDNR